MLSHVVAMLASLVVFACCSRPAFAWGPDAIVDRVRAHLDAGADHVCIQIIGSADPDEDVTVLRELAPALLSG